jgi:hypothetical protein
MCGVSMQACDADRAGSRDAGNSFDIAHYDAVVAEDARDGVK